MPKGYPILSVEEQDKQRQKRNDYSRKYCAEWRKKNPTYHKRYNDAYKRIECATLR